MHCIRWIDFVVALGQRVFGCKTVLSAHMHDSISAHNMYSCKTVLARTRILRRDYASAHMYSCKTLLAHSCIPTWMNCRRLFCPPFARCEVNVWWTPLNWPIHIVLCLNDNHHSLSRSEWTAVATLPLVDTEISCQHDDDDSSDSHDPGVLSCWMSR